MKQVIVNGKSYLAQALVQDENVLVVEQGMVTGDRVTKGDIAAYMKAENLGELKDITFGGAGVSFSELDLDKDIEFAIKVAELVMDEAKGTAVKKLINREFDGGLSSVGGAAGSVGGAAGSVGGAAGSVGGVWRA